MTARAREFRIIVGVVSPELTRAASRLIFCYFDGYTRADGFGGYRFADGHVVEESVVTWTIATAMADSDIYEFAAEFARAYCRAGNQESVYFADVGEFAYIIDAGGYIKPL